MTAATFPSLLCRTILQSDAFDLIFVCTRAKLRRYKERSLSEQHFQLSSIMAEEINSIISHALSICLSLKLIVHVPFICQLNISADHKLFSRRKIEPLYKTQGSLFPEEIFFKFSLSWNVCFDLFAFICTTTFPFALTLWRGTAGMLLVLLRYWLAPRAPVAGPEGLVGLGTHGLAPVLRCDEDDTAPGLNAGVLVGLLLEGDRWPQGPASACRNLAQRK